MHGNSNGKYPNMTSKLPSVEWMKVAANRPTEEQTMTMKSATLELCHCDCEPDYFPQFSYEGWKEVFDWFSANPTKPKRVNGYDFLPKTQKG